MAEEAALPTGVCRSCSDEAIAAGHFTNLCAQSNRHWGNATNYISTIHDPTKEDKAYFVIYNDENTIIKDQIGRVPNKEVALKRLNMRFYPCPEKDKIKPKKLHHLAKCNCPDCGKPFTVPEFLNRHLRHTLKRSCVQCGVVMHKHEIATHLAVEHGLYYIFCNMCHALFDNKDLLHQHMAENHSANTFSCTVCGNGYISDRALRSHLNSHSLFTCKACCQTFDNNKCYRYHLKQCRKVDTPVFKFYTCDHCGVTYNRKPSLRIHIVQKHLHVLPYVCQTCGKRTSTIGHLRSHEKVHKIERKVFECFCGAKLRTELGYQLHQRIHTGERPYECAHCGDRFLSSSRRLDHIKRRHRGNKDCPHACEKCTARFVRPCELKKHYLSAHYSVVNVMPAKRQINPITKRLRTTFEKV